MTGRKGNDGGFSSLRDASCASIVAISVEWLWGLFAMTYAYGFRRLLRRAPYGALLAMTGWGELKDELAFQRWNKCSDCAEVRVFWGNRTSGACPKKISQLKCKMSIYFASGWGGGIRTPECQDQNLVPYHLATPQWLQLRIYQCMVCKSNFFMFFLLPF